VNSEELNWLLETIQDARTAERFVTAQYEQGRISSHVMAALVRERAWINRTASQLLNTATRHLTEFATTELPVAIT
jgi:hypothetical protein